MFILELIFGFVSFDNFNDVFFSLFSMGGVVVVLQFNVIGRIFSCYWDDKEVVIFCWLLGV